ncbi:unnamed protein product, partial [Rotaria sp. Silwood2]
MVVEEQRLERVVQQRLAL